MNLDFSPFQLPPQEIERRKIEQMLDSSHLLCRDDLVWVLEYIKKKVAEKNPQLLELSQPRLLQNFHHFAEISLMLIQRRGGFDQEADQLKTWIHEAIFGLQPSPPAEPLAPKSFSFPSS
ncbi:hypothetical protein [Paenibacillus agricola]|uniref:Uncharacterized protein n=1 Tax=Paenibacillus agricola TaxID=2716264 RepID=A0ABX0IX61_9BACL|nr:hypothetical protein [Paenibacillus agricola]NHN28505.1 hypothetical protein [Paenibacillus agricola]